MSEDRTQEPSSRRRIEARERGQVARSPELTGASALLAASALLGIWGDDLALAMLGLIRETWSGDLGVGSDALGVVDRIRQSAFGVLGPLLGIVAGSAAAAIAAHQAQVGALFAPSLIAPDPSRLWRVNLDEEGSGPGLTDRLSRGMWSVVKATVVLLVAGWMIRSDLSELHHLARLEPRAMAIAAAGLIRGTALALAMATLVLGLVDFALQYQRFESMMRLTPDQHREDLRAADGDPGLRTRRRNQAKALRGDSPELLAGASIAVVGASGLIVILGGGPPPRRVTIRSSANGATGRRLRKSVDAANLPILDDDGLARSLALHRAPTLPAELAHALATRWPES